VNKLHYYKVRYGSTLTKESFDDMNANEELTKEQKAGKGIFNKGITLVNFGFDKDNFAKIEVMAEAFNAKDCYKKVNGFKKEFKKQFNANLTIEESDKGYAKFYK